jgi:hypothetical protein
VESFGKVMEILTAQGVQTLIHVTCMQCFALTGSKIILLLFFSSANGHNDDNNNNSNNPRGILKDATNQDTKTQITPGSPVLIRTYSSAGRLNKGHLFVTKSILRIESCGVVRISLKIKFSAFAC